MKEKYFEDLGLDGGEDIFKKFNIDVDEILGNKEQAQDVIDNKNDERKV